MKKWIRGLVFAIILALLVGRTYQILSWKDTYGPYFSATRQLYHTDDDLIDVVFMGSSHAFFGVNPAVLWEQYGISSFVMGSCSQDMDMTYHFLKELLKTQSPKVVCIDLYALTYEVSGEEIADDNIYRATLSMNPSLNSLQLILKEVDEEEQMQHILRLPIIHTRYQELEQEDFVDSDFDHFGRGYYRIFLSGGSPGISEELQDNTTAAVLSEESMEWLETMIALSEEEDFELVFFLTPYNIEENESAWEQYNAVKLYAQEHDIPVLDFFTLSEEIGLDYEQDFWNEYHLNSYGARKLTEYFGEYLHETVELADHRGDDSYWQWEWDLEDYLSEEQEYRMINAAASIDDFVDIVQNGRNLTYILTLCGDYWQYREDIAPVIAQFGINLNEYPNGGTWLFADGALQFIMDNSSEEAFVYELDSESTLRIENLSVRDPSVSTYENVKINGEAQMTAQNGMAIVVYDTYRHQTVGRIDYN